MPERNQHNSAKNEGVSLPANSNVIALTMQQQIDAITDPALKAQVIALMKQNEELQAQLGKFEAGIDAEGFLNVRMKISEQMSKSGKNIVLCSTHGNKVAPSFRYKNKDVTISLNAYVENEKYVAPAKGEQPTEQPGTETTQTGAEELEEKSDEVQ